MSSTKPLSGVVVIEIGHSIAAPYAGMILGELGAEVIKVENPKGGDACRGWGPPFAEDGAATCFHAVNRGAKNRFDRSRFLTNCTARSRSPDTRSRIITSPSCR